MKRILMMGHPSLNGFSIIERILTTDALFLSNCPRYVQVEASRVFSDMSGRKLAGIAMPTLGFLLA